MKIKSYCSLFFLLFFLCSFLYSKNFDWGSLNVRSLSKYQVQWSDTPDKNIVSGDSNDQDFYEILGVDAFHKKSGLSFNFLGKYKKDLDGTPEGSIFQDYVDTRANKEEVNILYAYIEKEDIFGKIDFRLGRQYAYSSETVHFDGLYLKLHDFGLKHVNLSLFGGSIVQYYSNLHQDGVGGINLEINPFEKFTFYIDSVFYQKTSYESGIYWMPLDYLKVNAKWSMINSHKRFWDINVEGTCPVTKTLVNFEVYNHYRIRVQDDFLYDYTSTVSDNIGKDIKRFFLGRELGYTDYIISLSQPIPKYEGIALFVRFMKRNIFHNYYEDLYNTDFYSWTTGLSIENFAPLKGTKFNLGFTYWKEQRNKYYEGKSKSFFADLEQEIGEKFEIKGGFFYKTEDVNSLIEGEAAHNYYGAIKYKFSEDKWAQIKYEYETDDYYHEFGLDHINILTISLHYTF